jgi:non-ribosomal peptide synthetase component F/thioesterase domain-containing protein/acyl carrier protein
MTDSTQPHIPAPDQEQDSPEQSILRVDNDAELYAFPLSPVQEQMWHAFLSHPKSPIYNASFRWQLEGSLDPRLIERSFEEIIRRHEVLRARFGVVEGEPRQLIAPEMKVGIARTDLSGMPPAERDAEFDRMSAVEAQTCFDLKTGPLLRIGLIRMEAKRHVLTLTLHHIICDGWSIGIIMEELQKIYAAFAEGKPSPLPELPIQYGDFVVWQKEFLQREEIRQQLAFWKKKLNGYSRLELAGDLAGDNDADRRSAIVSVLLPRELSEKLKEFSNQQGGTLFITTLAANIALLCAETGKTDIAIGSPLAGRNRSDLEGLIGVFINHVLLRVDTGGNPTFAELALRVRDTVWDAFANQDVPFEEVVREVAGKNGLPADAFYAINYICQREYARASTFIFEFAGLRMSTMPSKSQGALYDLNFFMVEREAGWRLSLEYRVAKYSEEFAKAIHGKFFELLKAIGENPNRKLSEIATPSKAAPIPPTGAESGERSSAVDSEEADLYSSPASVAQQRFWLLEKLTHGNAAFHMPAGVRLAGNLSAERLESAFSVVIGRHEMLRTTFVDSNGELLQIISPPSPFRLERTTVCGKDLADKEEKLQQLVRDESQIPFDLAKGPLLRARLFELSQDDHVLLLTLHHILADGWSQSILQKELWAAFAAEDQSGDAGLPPLNIQYSDFAAWQKEWLASEDSNEHRDFWLNALKPPLPVLDFPTDRPPQNRPASHGAIETYLLPPELAASLKACAQKNNSTMFTLMLACFGALLAKYSDQEDVVVGSPVANRRTETEPLIGPFAGPIALRLNLAGNPTLHELLTRVRDFTLDALSHSDLPFEVLLEKIRPLAVQRRNPLFQFYFFYQTAFLQPRKIGNLTVSPMPTFSVGTPFELQLGFVERQEGIRAQLEYNPDLFDSSTIRLILDYYGCILRALLGDAGIRLSELPAPRNPNVTSAATYHAQPQTRQFVAPRDSVELQLALMWERLIGRQPIGVHDDFFDIGGQSLLAAQMVTEIEKEFRKKIDLSTLLTAPTIEALAHRLQSEETGNQSSLVPIRATGSKPPLFCVHGGGGHVLRFRAMAARLDADQPFYGLRSPDADGAVARLTVEDLATKYISDIRAIQPKGPYFLAGASFGGLVAYEMATQLNAVGEKVGLLGLFDTGNPAYYRELSFGQSLQFQALYLIDRVRLYGRRLFKGETWQLLRDLGRSIGARTSYIVFRLAQKIYGWSHKPLPSALRDNVKMFSSVGQAYTPKPYSGELTLFRAKGRTAEYGSNLSLGWNEIVGGGVRVINVPGDHMTILEEPFVWDLVDELRTCLRKSANSGQ